MGTMTGLAALGFWMFIGAVVLGGIWSDIRKRESQQETLRRIVESGQKIDADLIDKMVGDIKDDKHPDRDLKTAGIITGFVGIALYVMGYFIANGDAGTLRIFLGIALLLGIIGCGLYLGGIMTLRWSKKDANQDQRRA